MGAFSEMALEMEEDRDSPNRRAYGRLREEVEYNPRAARRAREEAMGVIRNTTTNNLIPGTKPELNQKLPEGYSNSIIDVYGNEAETDNKWARDESDKPTES